MISNSKPLAVFLPDSGVPLRSAHRVLVNADIEARRIDSTDELAAVFDGVSTGLVFAGPESAGLLSPENSPTGVTAWIVADADHPQHFATAWQKSQIGGVVGRKDRDIRGWELLALAQRHVRGLEARPASFMAWGHSWAEHKVESTFHRRDILNEVEKFARHLQSGQGAQRSVLLADEMLANAVYDAPCDSQGHPKYAFQRNLDFELEVDEQPRFGIGSDGERLVLGIEDPYGRLERSHVFEGINRGLATGELNERQGGAGLGMMTMFRSATSIFFDVRAGAWTRVIAVVDLHQSVADRRKTSGSVYWAEG